MGEKMESWRSGDEESGGSEWRSGVVAEEVASWLWMLSIFEYLRKLLHFRVNEDEMLSWGLRSLFFGGKQSVWVGGSRMNDARVVERTGFVEC